MQRLYLISMMLLITFFQYKTAICQSNCKETTVTGITTEYGSNSTTICNSGSTFILQHESKNITVWDESNNINLCINSNAQLFADTDGHFEKDTLAYTAYWVAHHFHQFFSDSMNWYTTNQNSYPIQINISGRSGFWFCPASNVVLLDKDKLATIDIIAHELFHSITHFTANLNDKYEPAALKESVSDIFGEVIEHYILGDNDWIFDPLSLDTFQKRSFADPTIYYDAKTYLDQNWEYVFADAKYINSGVVNHWFYLLSNEIGIYNAAKIVFKAVTEKLCSDANFHNARHATVITTTEIYGSNSFEQQQVVNAWNSVHVFADSTITPVLNSNYELNTKEVWPGDADNNGIVNVKDILYICLSDGTCGYARQNTSNHWQAQSTSPWYSEIGGINKVYQDANGDGIIDINDIDVVDKNYGLQTNDHLPSKEYRSLALSLRPVHSDNPKEVIYALVLNNRSNDSIKAHGISGSIDMSSVTTSTEGLFSIDSTFNAVFGPDVIYTRYDSVAKKLHFAISKADGLEQEIEQNEPLLRVIVTAVDMIEGGGSRYFKITDSGIIKVNGHYQSISKVVSRVIKSAIPANSRMHLPDFTLNTKDYDCNSPGWAKIEFEEEISKDVSFTWRNLTENTDVEVLNYLNAGEYELTIKLSREIIAQVCFEIKKKNSLEAIMEFENTVLQSDIYKASKIIILNNGVEIGANKTVELVIDKCN